LEAKIALEYDEEKAAEAVSKAVSPDNLKTPKGLSVNTKRRARRVITHVIYDGKLPTFIATIDDLLFSVSTAEKAVQVAKKIE
jgi:tRNA threonylcarbamoyladenosine modification (KEOPS) complex  Pcc1 subunit